MKFIKPHLDQFHYEYQLMFDGNDYYITRSRKCCYPWEVERTYYKSKLSALIALFFKRRDQHKERDEQIERDARYLKEPIKIA